MTMLRPLGLDHVVLVVADVERSLEWYSGVVGGAPTRVEEWRAGEVLFPSVRLSDSTISSLGASGTHGASLNSNSCARRRATWHQ